LRQTQAIPEIEQELSKMFGSAITVTFTPQIMPVERGMLSSIYFNLNKKVTAAEAVAAYKDFYKDKKFVRVLDEGLLPSIKNVVNTNFCEIGLNIDERTASDSDFRDRQSGKGSFGRPCRI
jgi:N-acetyl-gamma-glutamyl-phosphate reductase